MKRTVAAAEHQASRLYQHSHQQLDNADSDDNDKVESATRSLVAAPRADSSSDQGMDAAARLYEQKKDYRYKELDDEFGSKRTTKEFHRSPDEDIGASGNVLYEEEDDVASDVTAVPKVDEEIVVADRIMGHEYGVRPLLDDDELSESEFYRASGNPFAHDVLAAAPKASPVPADVFDAAPFKLKTKPRKSKPNQSPDASAAAPTTMYVNEMVVNDAEAADVFGAVPFSNKSSSKSTPTAPTPLCQSTTISPQNVASPSLSPCRDHNPTLALNDRRPSAEQSEQFIEQSKLYVLQQALLRQQEQQQVELQFRAGLEAQQRQQAQLEQREMSTTSAFYDATHASAASGAQFESHDLQTSDVFGAVPFGALRHQPRPAASQNRQNGCVVTSPPPAVQVSRIERRHSSESYSSGGEDRPSPRGTIKKDNTIYKTGKYSKSSELLHDENLQVLHTGDTNYANLRKTPKHKPEKSEKRSSRHERSNPRERTASAFANLSFTEDVDGDRALIEGSGASGGALGVRLSESQHELGRDVTDVQRMHLTDTAEKEDQGSHTLPRAGSSKKRQRLTDSSTKKTFLFK